MFVSRVLRFIPVVANSRSGCGGLVLERLCAAYASFGLNTLVVDASDQARAPSELVAFDLGEGIETLSTQVSYMAARGLPGTVVASWGPQTRHEPSNKEFPSLTRKERAMKKAIVKLSIALTAAVPVAA